LRILGKKLQYIPLSSNISNNTPPEYTANPQEWRQAHGVATDQPIIAYFGYISENKGLHTLLEAVAKLKESYQLLLIAEPKAQDSNYQAYFERLEGQIKNLDLDQKIHWTGFATSALVAAYLQSATIAVLPFVDGVSLRRTSLMAALANATPVISTQATDSNEGQTLISGENIWLIPPENPQALAAAIQHLLQNPTLRQKLAENGQKFAQNFSWPAIAEQHLELYRHYLS
jgi:glycosyltransferase involved in cell wall biosynthesis